MHQCFIGTLLTFYRVTGLSAATLPHMDYEVAGTPAQRKVWQDKIDQQAAELKARGLLS